MNVWLNEFLYKSVRAFRVLAGVITLSIIGVSTLPVIALAAGSVLSQPEPELAGLWARQVLVVFEAVLGNPSLTDIVGAVSDPTRNAVLHQQLGRPVSARKLLFDDPPPAMATHLAANPDSPRAVLERYVVLTYQSAEDAAAALQVLRADLRVASVQRNNYFSASVTPNDTHFSGSSGAAPGSYQWGMQALNVPQAWDIERGTAYIADFGTGIYCSGGTSHPCTTHHDLIQNFREQFSTSYWPDGSGGFEPIAEHVFPVSGVNYSGHGTHVAGILAATPEYGSFTNHDTDTGVAGTCWTCSLATIKEPLDDASTANSIHFAVDHGIQVLNMSFGDARSHAFSNCGDHTNDLTCSEIAYATQNDVLIVASSGNWNANRIQFPAMHADTIAVGGIESGGVFWRSGYPTACSTPGTFGEECGSNWGAQTDGTTLQVVAPARDVVSTTYYGLDYNPTVHCGDTRGPLLGDLGSGYGDCTGTSMSSPHVAGIVALMRSANPLMAKNDIKRALYASTMGCTGTDSSKCGAGIPDAGKAVRLALGPGKNRLTPLFSLYALNANDHFYAIAPQMALAALNPGLLLPASTAGDAVYIPIGLAVPSYAQFPAPSSCASPCYSYATPRAMVSVFTSHVDPTSSSSELAPLVRMSCGPSTTACAITDSHHVRHVYTTSATEVASFKTVGYFVDGIEGYVYPTSKSQPLGTVKLCRKYSSATDDYIMFPGTGTGGGTCGSGDGYTRDNTGTLRTNYTTTVSSDWIGWVYPVTKAQAICANATPCSVLAASIILGDD